MQSFNGLVLLVVAMCGTVAMWQEQACAQAPDIATTRALWHTTNALVSGMVADVDGVLEDASHQRTRFFHLKATYYDQLTSIEEDESNECEDLGNAKWDGAETHKAAFDIEIGNFDAERTQADFFISEVEYGIDTSEEAKQLAWDYTNDTYNGHLDDLLVTWNYDGAMYDYPIARDRYQEGCAVYDDLIPFEY